MGTCKESDLKLILFCIDCGALPQDFLDDIQSPAAWVEDSLCENSIAIMRPPLYVNHLKTGNYPDIHAVAAKIKTLIQPRTYALPKACTIHVSDVDLMRVDWPQAAQAAGTRRRKNKSRKRKNKSRKRKSKW